MTTIAYDLSSLAADSACWTSREVYRHIRKIHDVVLGPEHIFRMGGYDHEGGRVLVSFSGWMMPMQSVLAWLRGGPRPDIFGHTKTDDYYWEAMIFRRGASSLLLDPHGLFLEFPEQVTAAGNGAPIALGALFAGASAARAVEIVGRVSNQASRGEVDVLAW